MNGHLKDLECGGRPMTKNELKIKKLEQENQQLKLKLEASEKARIEAIEFINGAGEMASYTKSIVLYEEEIEELLNILDIDKGE